MGDTRNGITRRRALLGAGAATVAAGATSLSARGAAAAEHWDREADIVIAGTGIGASTAAVAAHENGDAVIMFDKATVFGGTSAKTAAVLWIPNNFVLKERGIDDRKADCLKYMARFSYPQHFDPADATLGVSAEAYALLEAFYDNAAPAVDFLRQSGALDIAEWRMFALDHPATDYLAHVPENKVPQGRALGVRTQDGSLGIGVHMMKQMEQAVKNRDIPVLFGHRAVRLVQNDTGRVVGLEAEHDGKVVSIGARKAVIFATGGYAHNPDFVARHQRARQYGACALTSSTGDFINIAGAAGARIGNMSAAWRMQVMVEEALQAYALGIGVFLPPGDSSFQVNKYGRRAVNEASNYDDRAEVHAAFDPAKAEFPNQVMFWIYDQRTAEAFAGRHPLPEKPADSPYVIKGETLEALTARIGERLEKIAPDTGGLTLDPAFAQNLHATRERFNHFARTGVDEDFNRGASDYDTEWKRAWMPMRTDTDWPPNEGPNITLYPMRDKGPFYAMILGAGILDTCGGPAIDANARILDTSDAPIPGLYGAGNCIASPSAEAYWGGGCPLALSLTYGYIAANTAHREPRREG